MPSNSLNRGGSPEEPAGDPERLNNGQPARNSGQDSERLNIREELAEIWDQDLLFMSEPEYDEAIIGVVERAGGSPVIAYDTQKILEILERSMPMEDAQEFFEYNILGAYMGDRTPVYITSGDWLRLFK
jgi:hypothetical protein